MAAPRSRRPRASTPPASDADIVSTTDHDRMLAGAQGATGPAPTQPRGADAGTVTETQLDDEGGDADLGPDDDDFGGDLDADDGGDEGETGPSLPDPRVGGRDADFSAGATPFDVGRYGVGSRETLGTIDPIVRKLRSLGPQVVVRYQRLKPTDIPDSEMGWSDWVQLPAQNPTQEDIEKLICGRHGGGTYEVNVRSATDKSRFIAEPIRIVRSGQWRPSNPDGAEFFRSRYGAEPLMSGDGVTPAPAPIDPAIAGTHVGAATTLMTEAIRMSARAVERREDRDVARMNTEASTLQGVVAALTQPRSSIDWGAVLTAGVAYLGQQTAHRIEMLKLEAEQRRADREEARKDREALLSAIGSKNSGSQEAAALAAIDIVKTAAAGEGALKLDLMRGFVKQALQAGGLASDEEERDTIGSMVVDLLKDGIRNAPQIIALMKSGKPAPGTALPPGYVQLPDGRIATQEQVERARVAQRSRTLPPPPPPPPPPAPPPPPEPPSVQGDELTTEPSPVDPGTVALSPREEARIEPPMSPAESAEPVPAGNEAQGEVDGDDLGQLMRRYRTAITEQCHQYQYALLSEFAAFCSAPHDERPDGVTFWDRVIPDTDDTLEFAWGSSPRSFRKAISADHDEDGAPPISFVRFCGSSKVEPIVALARQIDEACLQDPTALEWVTEVLEEGPWTVDEPDTE